MTTSIARWRGLAAVLRDAVEHGSRAVERVQKETAARPFGLLEAIPPIAGPTRIVHAVYDATTTTVHVSIRTINGLVGTALDGVLAVVEKREGKEREGT